MTRRKHYEQRIAHAEGYDIECKNDGSDQWYNCSQPHWVDNVEYRVKDPYRELREAEKDGKIIQITGGSNWYDIVHKAELNFHVEDYRIKPEPEYIPFEWEDREPLRDKWLKEKEGHDEFKIISFLESSLGLCVNGYNSKYLFKNYTFLDGSIFGKIKK